MPKVRATEKCFVDNALREAGDVFNYDGPATPFLEPLEPVAEEIKPQATVEPPAAAAPRKWAPRRRSTATPDA